MTDIPTPRGSLVKDASLAKMTWMRVGGAADVLFRPEDEDDLAAFLNGLPSHTPVFPLGVGSNLIVRDGGIEGVVIRLGKGFQNIQIDGDTVIAGGACLDSQIAKKAAMAGVDLTFLSTIPGTIGGGVRMNAGCFGGYVSDVFEAAKIITREGEIRRITARDIRFDYRASSLPPDAIVTEVTLRGSRAQANELLDKITHQRALRDKTQPTGERCAGSTFRNPAGASSTGEEGENHDLKAWKLIQEAGLCGHSIGGAQMSTKHCNFMLNTGHARAAELEALGESIRKKVYEDRGILLNWEIVRVGRARSRSV